MMVVNARGSDLHLTAGSAPIIRVNGNLHLQPLPMLRPQHMRALVHSILTAEQIAQFEKDLELDFSFGISDAGRFRANIFLQRGSISAMFRHIPQEMPTLESLHMPAVLRELCALQCGLVLVTGPTGSGKTTTLAAMINEMNQHRGAHIVTMEDPIEFVHRHHKCED